MAIDSLADWKSTLTALPKVADNSWAANFANWYYDRIINIETDPSFLDSSAGFIFTFDTATFQTELEALTPTDNATTGITGFADAWETALLASAALVATGAFVPPPGNPATTFSAVASTVIDIPSITAGKNKLLELTTAPPTANALTSDFATKFREATLLLTITVAGTNSASPTPAPLTVPNVPLI